MSEKDMKESATDLRTLIQQAIDDRPPHDLPERVMAKLALMATAIELFRLASEAPLTGLFDGDQDAEPAQTNGDTSYQTALDDKQKHQTQGEEKS